MKSNRNLDEGKIQDHEKLVPVYVTKVTWFNILPFTIRINYSNCRAGPNKYVLIISYVHTSKAIYSETWTKTYSRSIYNLL